MENMIWYKIDVEKYNDLCMMIIMKLVSIVIPTNKQFAVRKPLLMCISQQSYPRIEVVLVVDRQIMGREFDQMSKEIHTMLDLAWVQVRLITPHNTIFVAGKGASFVRNYGAEVATGEYLLYMDDDGIVTCDFVQQMVARYEDVYQKVWHDVVLSPTIMYRDTGQIQTQWFDRVWRGVCWPQPHYAPSGKAKLRKYIVTWSTTTKPTIANCISIQMKSAMWLFAPRVVFQLIQFDNQFEFVYEDLDFGYRAHHAWFTMLVASDITVNHMESPRNLSQTSYLWSPRNVYYKARNRIFFVRNNAPWWWKLVFYLCGCWLQLWWFAAIIIYDGSERLTSLWMLIKGTWDWFVNYKH
jgi:GT2 family glycosyltransferase